jgi:hypothetical protein
MGVVDPARAARQAERENQNSWKISGLPRRQGCLELADTNKRKEILIHPGRGFLSSVGCINPAKSLANAGSDLNFLDSRTRAISLIDDLSAFLGAKFPTRNDRPIPNAFVVIEGEP